MDVEINLMLGDDFRKIKTLFLNGRVRQHI